MPPACSTATPTRCTDIDEWQAERALILRQDAVAELDEAGRAYADALLRACQDGIFRPLLARAMLADLPPYDYWLVCDLADAIQAVPLPNPERRGALYGALQMAHALIWSDAQKAEGL